MDEIRDHFRSVAAVMAAQAEVAGATKHAATTGAAREVVVHKFLTPHLPRNLDLRSGVVIDSTGARSRQQDCLILDTRLPIIDIGSASDALVIAESVIATIEVKSQLTGAELQSALESSLETKQLTRRGEQHYHKGGAVVVLPQPEPIWTYVFAFGGASLASLAKRMFEFASQHGTNYLPGAVCVLDQGVILCPHFMPRIRGSNVTLPALREPKMHVRPYSRDALLAFYRRLIDDVVPLRLVNYDFDAYYQSGDLE